MLEKSIVELLNAQINMEWYSAYLYLDISNFYADKNLDGFSNWYRVQTQEERDHAMLFLQYLLNNSELVKFTSVAAPESGYPDFRTPAVISLEHEQMVTASINRIYAAAYEKKDFRTMQFLDWFVKEQGEEEKNADDIIRRYDLFGSDPKGLYLLDKDLGARVYAPPTLVL